MICHITSPLWVVGTGAEGWLFAPRASAEPMVAIGNIDGPRVVGRDATDLRNVGFQLLDAVWLETTANALVGIPITETRLRRYSTWRFSWEQHTPWRAALPADVTLVTGFAVANVENGIDLHVRSATDPADTVLQGPLRSVRAALLDRLVAKGIKRVADRGTLCNRVSDVPPVHSAAYAAVCEGLQLLVLAGIELIAPRPEPEQRAAVALAGDLARAAASSDVAQLAWFATATRAHEAGGLARDQRKAVLASLRARTAHDDPIRRLAPGFYRRLGEVDTARTLARAALAELGAPEDDPYRASPADPARDRYRAWLQGVIG